MKKPTSKDKINLRTTGYGEKHLYNGIVGVHVYPLVIHRLTSEFEEIQSGQRQRYGSRWTITHIPTGKAFGITSSHWEDIVEYVEGIKDEPALLMMTDETMTGHPQYQQLVNRHNELRRNIRRY